MNILAERLKTRRTELGWSQAELQVAAHVKMIADLAAPAFTPP